MRAISFILLGFLVVSCGKSKKQTPAGAAAAPKTVSGNSSTNSPANAAAMPGIAAGGCHGATTEISNGIATYMEKNLDNERRREKEFVGAHCVMTLKMENGDCIESHSLYTVHRRTPRKRFINVRKRVLSKDLNETIATPVDKRLVIGRQTTVSNENFEIVHDDDNQVTAVNFRVPETGEKLLMPLEEVSGVASSAHACSML